jgi:hypothetical protein
MAAGNPDKAIYLAGSHHRQNLQDGGGCPPQPFPFNTTYPTTLNHNFIRGWHWEHAKWIRVPPAPGPGEECITPLPFVRGQDGRFHLFSHDESYLDRLRARAQAAASRGRYLSLMLFQGFSVEGIDPGEDPFSSHPFRAGNNVNGIDGNWAQPDPGNLYPDLSELHVFDDKGLPPRPPGLVSAQESYIEAMVGAMNGFDNIFWEVSNESGKHSVDWHEWVIQKIRAADHPQRHLVWFSHPRGVDNVTLFASFADIVSPSANEPAVRANGTTTTGSAYRNDPPATSGAKVVILDTDHLRPQCTLSPQWCGDQWPWKAFTRGYHIALLDDFGNGGPHPAMRRAIADTVTYAERIRLVDMAPQNEANAGPCSTRYCLYTAADPDPHPYQQPPADGGEYLVFKPSGSTSFVIQGVPAGSYQLEWFHVSTPCPSGGCTRVEGPVVHLGGDRGFTRPSGWGTAATALWLRRVVPAAPQLVVEVGGQVRPRDSSEGFGATPVGQPVPRVFTLRNTGTAVLHVSDVRLDGGSGGYSLVDPSPFDLVPGANRAVTVTLTAESAGSFPDTLEILSDDPGGAYPINLTGTVFAVGSCVPSSTTLCLQDERFAVTLQFFDHHNGGSGPGKKIDFSDRSGLFWFFNSANVEVMVKVLGPHNGYWWVFHGGLTDLAYTLTVRDTVTGNIATYEKDAGGLCGGGDTSALPDGGSGLGRSLVDELMVVPLPLDPSAANGSGTCSPGSTNLCLLGQRFAVEIDFVDPGSGATLSGRAVPFNDRTGFFWFFNSGNLELPVKMIDATGPFGHFWVFFGSLTNIDYTVRVTDTVTGAVRSYPGGAPFCGQADTTAFPAP